MEIRREKMSVHPRCFSVLAALLVVFTVVPAFAIPFKTANEFTQESNPLNEASGNWDLDWSYVYNYKGSTGTAIDSHWLLTAAHVADDNANGTITIGTTSYTPQETRYYDGSPNGTSDSHAATRDIALVRFNNSFPGYYSYATGTAYTNDDAILVGYGFSGTVTQSAFSGSWTDSGLNKEKRWGTNNIDGSFSVDAGYGTYLYYRTSISGTTSSSNTDYETGLNIHDSGGPLFVKDGTQWIVAGINTNRAGNPWDATYSVRVGDYDEWIGNTVPEPMTILFLLLGFASFSFLRRRQR